MAEVTLSKAVRSNLLNLQSTAAQLGKTQERLATGLKVNSALDNPTNFFTASSLNSRASDLGRLLDSVSNAVQTIAAADKGISAITKLVESAQATARQALQTAATVDTTTVSAQATVTGTVAIGTDTQATSIGTVAIGDDVEATSTGNVAISADVAATVTGSTTFTNDVTATATGSTTLTGGTGSTSLFDAGDTFAVTVGATTRTYTFNSGGANTGTDIDLATETDVDAVLARIEADLQANGGAGATGATVGLNGDGNVEITLGANVTDSITTVSVLDSKAGFGIADDTFGPTSAALTALAAESLTITTDAGTDVLSFANIKSVEDLTAALSALDSTNNSGASFSLSSGQIKIDAADNTAASAFTVSGAAASTAAGITAQEYEGTNTAIAALSGTLTFTTDTGVDTLTFGAGNIQNRADLEEALAGLSTSGVTASISSNFLTFSGANGESVTVGGSIDASAAFGVTEQAYDATNTAIAALSGTLTFTTDTGVDTLTFGSGNIQTRAALESALSGFTNSGVTASVDSNDFLTFTGANSEAVTVGGTIDGAAAFGVAEQAYNATNASLSSLTGTLTIGSNTLTFGGSGITTRAGLTEALSGLSGGITGSITSGTNFLSFSGSGGSSFTVGGTLDNATAFGVAEQAYTATSTSGTSANPKRDELRVQYNDLLDQIDQLAKDSGFNGVNLLNGDSLSVLFNEDGSSSLDVTGVTYSSTGLGLSALNSGDFDTNASINSTLDTLKAGVDSLRTQASKFGSNLSVVETRQDFTKNMINVLQTGAANLTLADTNEEAANLLALQTRQQLSSTALSLASQSDQNVLRLF